MRALSRAARRRPVVFHTPGHKRGQWVPAGWMARTGVPWAWDGGDAVRDPAHGDDLLEAASEAARLAARAWGSERSWLLWNGATAGVLAMVLASVPPGGRLLMPRWVHRSVIDALVLADAMPVFLPCRWLEGWGMTLPPTPQDVAAARAAGPDAVLVTSPTYEGVVADVPGIAAASRPSPLLVDEAHGAHLAFYPAPAPPTGVRCGAHLVVHGAHKTLPVLTQAALLHWTGPHGEPDADRVDRVLAWVQSTSPQPALLASLDAARLEMERHGPSRVARAVELARRARAAIEASGPYRCLAPTDLPASYVLDETRLTVDVTGLGLPGWEVAAALRRRHGVWPEMAGGSYVVFIVTGADDEASVGSLASALGALAREVAGGDGRRARCDGSTGRWGDAMPPAGPLVMRPRRAALGAARRVLWEQAVGHVSAATVTPYPPGTPLAIPGEMITDEVASFALRLVASGAQLRGSPGQGREAWVVDA
ncbi:aminotransferase class I/II-fold pyridoxal phosphate-dependent enzyme [Geochorda subterranea]|uniref:Aminotransferase class I/II-fold pyridoxal phosphate-dependent enzyme n=1 Tax=Geochorda subterranea TaxID=3109564 RepID=A0ABZ1BN39_9FIRM|nr:aminotransferase class I/II-fold pyridoxal phosphate-dependent enzyme [Limnochorda sp. LNt]WRP14259.1 aminotransferase class I/II-fold pyridoxal phosphate-dependent enzyme [Limnochorda sp. LNt]